MRVVLLKNFVKQHFPASPLLDYALEVEKITVSKVIYRTKKFTVKSLSNFTVKYNQFALVFYKLIFKIFFILKILKKTKSIVKLLASFI